jgi:truncated hemoglobin YjbI
MGSHPSPEHKTKMGAFHMTGEKFTLMLYCFHMTNIPMNSCLQIKQESIFLNVVKKIWKFCIGA